MNKMDTKDIQKCLFEMMKWFDQYAASNNINYYLSGGTLLGAVRHQGFIPWDDDLDIMIPRSDYERLIQIFEGERYKLICCENDKDYHTPFARLWDSNTICVYPRFQGKEFGAFIDIFPIDGYPSSAIISKVHTYILKYKRSVINQVTKNYFNENEKFRAIKKIIRLLYRNNGNYYCNKLNKFAKKYQFELCDYVGVTTTTGHILRERNSAELFKETKHLQFEGLSLPAPGGYDKYLRHLYGDYMKLPPKSQQVSEHDYELFWRD